MRIAKWDYSKVAFNGLLPRRKSHHKIDMDYPKSPLDVCPPPSSISIQTTHIFGCCGNSTRFPFPPPPIHSCSHGSILLCLVSIVFWARLGLPVCDTHRTENMKLRLFLEVQTTKLDGMGNLLLPPHLINPINNYLQIAKLSPLGCTQLPP